MGRWRQSDVSLADIMYQLHLSGITPITEDKEEELATSKTTGTHEEGLFAGLC